MKIRILAICAVVASTFTAVACSFGPDAYNGTPVCPGDPPPDTVTVPDGECWDGGGLPPDAGTDAGTAGGGDTAGGGGGDATAGASAAGTAGMSSAGTGGASTAGTGGASAGSGG